MTTATDVTREEMLRCYANVALEGFTILTGYLSRHDLLDHDLHHPSLPEGLTVAACLLAVALAARGLIHAHPDVRIPREDVQDRVFEALYAAGRVCWETCGAEGHE